MGGVKTYEVTFSRQLEEVRQEIAWRQSYYGVQVRAQKMRQEVAAEKLATMRAVLMTLEEIQTRTIERFNDVACDLALPRRVQQMEGI